MKVSARATIQLPARPRGLAPPKRPWLRLGEGSAKASRSRSRHASLARRFAGVAGWRGEAASAAQAGWVKPIG